MLHRGSEVLGAGGQVEGEEHGQQQVRSDASLSLLLRPGPDDQPGHVVHQPYDTHNLM